MQIRVSKNNSEIYIVFYQDEGDVQPDFIVSYNTPEESLKAVEQYLKETLTTSALVNGKPKETVADILKEISIHI